MTGPKRSGRSSLFRVCSSFLFLFALLFVSPHGANAVKPSQGPELGVAHAERGGSDNEAREEGNVKQREEWFYGQRAYPSKHIPPGALRNARRQAERVPKLGSPGSPTSAPQSSSGESTFAPLVSAAASPSPLNWAELGPRPLTGTNLPVYQGTSPFAGRITAIAPHPTDSATAYIGGADGGVWKTGNSGGTWNPVFDTQDSLSIGAIAIDPTTPQTLYVGTGEANFSTGDSYFGTGVYRSTNGGTSWSPFGSPNFAKCYTSDIAVDPGDSNTVRVAVHYFGRYSTSCPEGVYVTHDGGTNWTRELFGCLPTDLYVSSTRVWYAAFYGCSGHILYRSTDGVHWSDISPTAAGDTRTARTIIAGARQDAARLYVVTGDSSNGGLYGLWETTNAGAATPSWSAWSVPATTGVYDTDPCGRVLVNSVLRSGQCSLYDLVLGVSPANEDRVYLGGVQLFRSESNGPWSNLGQSPGGFHVDLHALAFDASSPSLLWIGSDGGVYRYDGSAFTNLDNQLPLLQYEPGTSGSLEDVFVGGTQDNGFTKRTSNGQWIRDNPSIGDSGYSAVDPTDSNTIYSTYPGGSLYKTTDGSTTWNYLASQPWLNANDRVQFYFPFLMDPGERSRLYVGTQRVWRSTDSGTSWQTVPPSFAGWAGTVTAIGPSPSDHSTLYAATVNPRHIYVTRDDGTTWSDSSSGLAAGYVTDIVVDPSNPGRAWATQSGFGAGHVFMTTDYGQNWTDISGSLPDSPVNAVAVDVRTNPASVYVGSDVGVFASYDLGGQWFGLTGLPNSVVMDLILDLRSDKLVASTHGRGVYAAPVPDLNPNRGTGTLAFDSDAGGDYDIYTINANGTGLNNLINDSASPHGDFEPVWSPDGKKIAFTTNRDGNNEIYVMNSDGSSAFDLSSDPASDFEPDWSPDGRKIAWVRDIGNNKEIFVKNADGSGQAQNLTQNAGQDYDPDWSPDGTKIAFSSLRAAASSYEIYVMNADGTGVTAPLTNSSGIDEFPDWSPTGSKLAFDSNRDGNYNIYVMNANGTGLTVPLTNSRLDDTEPLWSPGGDRLAFTSARDGDSEIFTMNSDGTAQTNLTANTAADFEAAWKPPSISYPRPGSGSPLRVPLMPTFSRCTSPNAIHTGPLNYDSCNPPVLESSVLKTSSVGKGGAFARLDVIPGNLSTFADEADIVLSAVMTDVEKSSDGSDYVGNVLLTTTIRATDKQNSFGQSGTVQDTQLSAPVSCVATPDTSIGSTCNLSTTADTLLPGFANEGKLTVLSAFSMLVKDAGPNGSGYGAGCPPTCGDGDEGVYLRQGVFAP
jgi:Tol biopolymer transport system component/photosystem II stability/assembly factor-like uncharacterized protein